ncbi:MAG: hypothetical protein LR017_03655 [Candidatus Pacebacteria bacterium]|nr:hypothetical protein [Candidatus Paceibacterota bacterium]
MLTHLTRTIATLCIVGAARVAMAETAVLKNPLKATSVTDLLVDILEILLVFAVPVIVFFIIYSGFLFVTAAGDTNKITTARVALTWAVIGGVIVIGARAITTVIENTVGNL